MLCDRHSMGYGVDHSGRVKGSEPCRTPRPPSRLASCRESSTRLHDRGISRPALLRSSFVPACTDYGRAWQPVLSPAFAVFHPMLASAHAGTHARTPHSNTLMLFCFACFFRSVADGQRHQTKTPRPADSAHPTPGGSGTGTAPPTAPAHLCACAPRGCGPRGGGRAVTERRLAVRRARGRR